MHIAISRGLARYLAETEGFHEESFEIVHYGITPNGEPEPYTDTVPRLLCVGRLIPIKGHIVLLRAFAAAKRRCPGSTLDVAGRGPLEPALRALARELGVADSVRFLGYVAPIQGAIERSAIVVVPSMGEGFGMVALEAMERARPVIAAEIGGLGELVRDGETGLLVAPGEAEPLRAAIVALAGNLGRAAEMGQAGRRRALLEFLEQRCVDRTEILYRSALRPRVDRRSSLGHLRDRELASRPREPGLAHRSRPRGVAEQRQRRLRERVRVVRRHEQPRLAVQDDLRGRADPRRHHRLPGQHRLEQRQAEALPARRMDEHLGAPVPRGDVADAARQIDALAGERLQPRPLRALAQDDQHRRRLALADRRAARGRRRRSPSARPAARRRAGRVHSQAQAPRRPRPTARAARRGRSGRPRPSPPAGRPGRRRTAAAPL